VAWGLLEKLIRYDGLESFFHPLQLQAPVQHGLHGGKTLPHQLHNLGGFLLLQQLGAFAAGEAGEGEEQDCSP